MKTRILIAALMLGSFASAAHAESDAYQPYQYDVQQRGTDKRQTYDRVVAEAPVKCDSEGGYVANVRYTYLSGFGAMEGNHFVKAEVLCHPTPPVQPRRPVAGGSFLQ